MKKTQKILYITIFFVAVLLPTLLTVFGVKSVNYEKRALAEPPRLMKEDKINLAVTADFDAYFSDNFALRPVFVTAYNKLVKTAFNTSAAPDVVVGKNDFLYYSYTVPVYQGENLLSEAELQQICDKLKAAQDALQAQGKAFFFVVAPDKNTIYPEFMPDRYVRYEGESNMDRLYAMMHRDGINTVALTQALSQAKTKGLVYHRWDTHWNNFGAMVAYNEMMKKTEELLPGHMYKDFLNMNYTEQRTWTGDLTRMLYPASQKKDVQMVYEFEKTYTSERPIVNVRALEIETQNEAADTRALVFRDSFVNAQIQFLSESFSYIQYQRGVPYDFNLANAVDADIVILEIVERNIPQLLNNLP